MRDSVVFVTGASGFIGRHLVAALVGAQYRVRALVRTESTMGFDPAVEVIRGDLRNPASYARALTGAESIVHAGLTEDFKNDVSMTEALAEAASQAGIRQFVHLSSIAVYGNPREGVITEDRVPLESDDAYVTAKRRIEEILPSVSGIAEMVVLRLGCVYGPGGGWWSHTLLNMMRHGKLILVDGGRGIANLVHVSDVCAAVLATLARSNAAFEIFNVTDGQPVTWAEYFAALERVAGKTGTAPMTCKDAKRFSAEWRHASITKRLLRKMRGEEPIYPMEDRSIEGYTSRAIYSNRKAVEQLHFYPLFDLQAGMQTVQATRQ